MKYLILLFTCSTVMASACKKTNTSVPPDFSDSSFYFRFTFNNIDYNYTGYSTTGSDLLSLISRSYDPAPTNPDSTHYVKLEIYYPQNLPPTKNDLLSLKGRTMHYSEEEGFYVPTPYIYYRYSQKDTGANAHYWDCQFNTLDTSYKFTITDVTYLTTYTSGSSSLHYYTITGTCKARMREEGSNIVSLADLTGSFHLLAVIGN